MHSSDVKLDVNLADSTKRLYLFLKMLICIPNTLIIDAVCVFRRREEIYRVNRAARYHRGFALSITVSFC